MASFARDEKQFYRALFLERGEFKEIINDFLDNLKRNLVKDVRLVSLTELERGALLEKMAIVTHGLASMICIGICEDESTEYIEGVLSGIGTCVIKGALEQSEQNREK